jgi:hypothetical protein
MATSTSNPSIPSAITTPSSASALHSNPSLPSPFTTLQQTALKELPKFTGESDQNVTQFVDTVEHIGGFTGWGATELHTLATIKLGGLAFIWYNNNKDDLNTWLSLKTLLLERFQPSLSVTKTQLKNRRQQPGESLSTFYDAILELCKRVDRQMPMYMIVDYLVDGVRDDLRIHVKRRIASYSSDSVNVALFLKIARAEDELQNDVSLVPPPSSFSQPYFGPVAATTYRSPPSQHSTSDRPPTVVYRNSSSRSFHPDTSHSAQTYRPCLICSRSTHRTIDCPRKQPSGCFKCGNTGHSVRTCSQVFQ